MADEDGIIISLSSHDRLSDEDIIMLRLLLEKSIQRHPPTGKTVIEFQRLSNSVELEVFSASKRTHKVKEQTFSNNLRIFALDAEEENCHSSRSAPAIAELIKAIRLIAREVDKYDQ